MNEITGHVTKYLVQYRPMKKQGIEKNEWINKTVKSNEGFGSVELAQKMRSLGFSGGFTAHNLVCGSSYEFTVTSFNAVGKSVPSDTLVLSTRGKSKKHRKNWLKIWSKKQPEYLTSLKVKKPEALDSTSRMFA